MRASAPLLALASIALAKGSTEKRADYSNADDSTGVTLYVSSPACDYYQCHVDWTYGDTVAVNWLNPPAKGGNVSVQLASNIGGPTYDIVDSYPSVTSDCDAGSGVGVAVKGVKCGRLEFEVPSGWKKMDNYTVVVQSLIDSDAVGYTDNVNIQSGSSSAPSGTSVQIISGGSSAAAASSSKTAAKSATSSAAAASSAAATTTSAAKSSAAAASSASSASTASTQSAASKSTTSALSSAASGAASSVATSKASSTKASSSKSSASSKTKTKTPSSASSSSAAASASSSASKSSSQVATSPAESLVAKSGLAVVALVAGLAVLI